MKRFFVRALALSLPVLFGTACVFASPPAANNDDDPAVVLAVDLNKYMGRWYEIAHSPNNFQKDCVRSTAEYTMNADGSVKVHNVCTLADGGTRDIEGLASVADPAVPAKLVVDFGFLRKGDYWIIDLEPSYQWAVVSGPGKESLFILSRTAPMDLQTLQPILERLAEQGFKTDELVFDQY